MLLLLPIFLCCCIYDSCIASKFIVDILYLLGTNTGIQNHIDWIPLNTGSIRPTQGKTCLVAQVNGGRLSFNAINALRLLAQWMRMPCCTNQSSVAKAWNEFDGNQMKDSSFRDRVVDCAEEFAKFTALIRGPRADELTDRYSERKVKEQQSGGRLLTQAKKKQMNNLETTIEKSRQA
jgi:arsenic resistance protein ArsH